MTIPRRVFLVVWWFDRFGGMERHVADLALALDTQGVKVTVFCERPLPRDNRYAARLRAAGVQVAAPSAVAALLDDSRLYRRLSDHVAARTPFRRRAGRDRLRAPSTHRLLSAMDRAARAAAPSVVHIHGCRLGQRQVLQWAAARGIPSVYTEHLTIADWGGPADPGSPEIFASTADALACVSVRSRDSLRAALPAPRDIAVVRHVIDDPLVDAPVSGPAAAGAALADTPVGWARLLAVGRLAPHKGYGTLLHALARLRDDGLRFHLRIAGGGDQRAELEALRDRLGLGGAVTFLGAVAPERIDDLWRATDIAVLASLTEGLPLTIVEAMAHARTIVATRVGGIPEIIADGENGLLVAPDDAESLAAALRRVILDPDLAARLAAAARRAFEAGGWSREAVAARTIAIYGDAARRCAARQRPQESVKPAPPVAHVCMLAWSLAAMGAMEARIARQAAVLARAGVDVALFLERPARPFNRYVRAMRRSGVRVVQPSWGAFLAHRLAAWLGNRGASPLARAIAAAVEARRPDALHVHGWRAGRGWRSLDAVWRLADALDIPAPFTEHANDPDPQGDGDGSDPAVLSETVALYRGARAVGRPDLARG